MASFEADHPIGPDSEAIADAQPGPPETVRSKLWSAISGPTRVLKAKDMSEACAFYDAVRKDARRKDRDLVIDVCGGHGAVGMLFVAHGAARRALIIDQQRPASHDALREAWAQHFGFDPAKRVTYDERPLRESLPEALASETQTLAPGGILVVACHACQHLARNIADFCLAARVDFAVCPCCPKDPLGGIQDAARALGVGFGNAMTLAEMGRIGGKDASCIVRLRNFDASISPHNNVILGIFDSHVQGETADGALAAPTHAEQDADQRMRVAYERAHHRTPTAAATARAASAGAAGAAVAQPPPTASGHAAAGSCGKASPALVAPTRESYEAHLSDKLALVAAKLSPLADTSGNCSTKTLNPVLLVPPGLEICRSPARHFRARTVVSVGEVDATAAGEGLFRLVPAAGGAFQLRATLPVETLLEPVAASLFVLAELLHEEAALTQLRPGLRCIKLHATLGGNPPQLLACFIYDKGSSAPSEATLQMARQDLAAALAQNGTLVEVFVLAQAKGVQRCAPSGRDFVDEALPLGGRTLRYRQPFGQFSNPNPHIAIATGEWLLDVVRTAVNADNNGAPSTDLLELYCGAGSHTMALAPMFKHVLAVEINRHLVDAAKHNVNANALSNVTVVRAPSEEFCRRVIRRRTYELRGEDAVPKQTLNFGCTVVDPPRAGLDDLTRSAVAGYDHVLYVSCNPEALRVDLESLLRTHEVCRMVLLDHFPFSSHVETAVHLRRRPPGAVATVPATG